MKLPFKKVIVLLAHLAIMQNAMTQQVFVFLTTLLLQRNWLRKRELRRLLFLIGIFIMVMELLNNFIKMIRFFSFLFIDVIT
jgi:diacylglycerol kinase